VVALSAVERLLVEATIGNTPVRELAVRIGALEHRVLLKLESANGGGGSIKARTARSLLDQASASGDLRPGGTVVESTSGNLGAALAIQAGVRGLKAILVADPKTTAANLEKIRAAGARVEMVDSADANGGYLEARIARVEELLELNPESVWPNQYRSASNPAIHYWQTGPEIVAAAPEADAIFVACSTGGTAAGIADRVRAAGVGAVVVPVDVPGSHALCPGEGTRLLTGIGSALRSRFIGPEERARACFVDDAEAIAACRLLESEVGIGVGGSSGAGFVGALQWLGRQAAAKTVVVLCADGAENYDFGNRALRELGITRLPRLEHLLDDLAEDPGAPVRSRPPIAVNQYQGGPNARGKRDAEDRRCRQQAAGAGKGAERRGPRTAWALQPK
jgi:cysteine synthase A